MDRRKSKLTGSDEAPAAGAPAPRPRARRSGLKRQRTGSELLVYDLDRHRAHALSPLAAAVLDRCDGATTPEGMAPGVGEAVGGEVDAWVVTEVLERLSRAHLLESGVGFERRTSRREFAASLKRVGLAASAMLPLVSSIVSPTPAHALSCVAHQSCGGMPNCTPCENPGGNCNGNWRCCDGVCTNPGQARKDCGC